MYDQLNPLLYERLTEELGTVIVSNAGVASDCHYGLNLTGDRMKLHVSAGEYYRTRCPFCSDQRHRLWISYLWGVPDAVTHSKNLWLAICYNEGCLKEEGRPYELYDRIYGFKNAALRGRELVIRPGKPKSQELQEVTLPGVTLNLADLPAHVPVVTYLTERRFNHVELGQTFNVGYCVDHGTSLPLVTNRIVIPVHMRGKLVGWQCRHVGDDYRMLGVPKYYNMPNMQRRYMLYNFDVARTYAHVVLTEGPMDVWRVGPSAVASFGKSLSIQQLRLLCEYWANGTIVIMLDGDAWADVQKLAEKLKQEHYSGAIVPVHLPEDKDPGGMDRAEIWDHIHAACSANGVTLSDNRDEQYDKNEHRHKQFYIAPGHHHTS